MITSEKLKRNLNRRSDLELSDIYSKAKESYTYFRSLKNDPRLPSVDGARFERGTNNAINVLIESGWILNRRSGWPNIGNPAVRKVMQFIWR